MALTEQENNLKEAAMCKSVAEMMALMKNEDPEVQSRLKVHERAILENQRKIIEQLSYKIDPQIKKKRHNKQTEVWRLENIEVSNAEQRMLGYAIGQLVEERINFGVKVVRLVGVLEKNRDLIFVAGNGDNGREIVQFSAEANEKAKPRQMRRLANEALARQMKNVVE